MNAKIKSITKKAWKEQLDKPINSGKVATIKAPKGKCSKKKK